MATLQSGIALNERRASSVPTTVSPCHLPRRPRLVLRDRVMVRRPAAILLDLDDTIIDYGGGADASWRRVCDDAAAQVAGLDAHTLLDEIARVRRWYWSDPERHRSGRADLRVASCQIIEQALATLGCARIGLAQ